MEQLGQIIVFANDSAMDSLSFMVVSQCICLLVAYGLCL